ncbi:MAG: hypothetical protein ACTSUK_08400 [Promethearchaeota archaeon]
MGKTRWGVIGARETVDFKEAEHNRSSGIKEIKMNENNKTKNTTVLIPKSSKIVENTTIPICKNLTLEIKEVRQTMHEYSPTKTSSETKVTFHWKLKGIASKLSCAMIASNDFDVKNQEIYDVSIKSHGYDFNLSSGFKSRENAIQNAFEFAKRNNIEIDGYENNIS